jgi:type II secretory pathway pseudopilin PulG
VRSQRRKGRPRRGYTLIEMVIVIGAAMLIMGLVGSLLGALFKVERGSRAAVNDATTVSRLARQFREDVHASESLKTTTPKPSGIGLELIGIDGATTAYLVDGGRLIREASREGKVRAREAYAIERLGPLTFGVEGKRAWLILARHVEEGAGVSRPEVRVEATVGKNHGLLASKTKPKGDQ